VTGLVAAVVGVNVALTAAGYFVLEPALKGRSRSEWASYAGVALLVGAGLVGVIVFGAAVVGATTGPITFAVAAVLVSAAGLGASKSARARTWLEAPRPGARPRDVAVWESAVATAACFGVVVVCAFAVVGAFRASPWLDDAWGIWLPKGLALVEHGLDERLFVPNGEYVFFEVPDYPLWWAALTGLDVRLAGDLDVRAMNAQVALLTVAFVAAAARLLWGFVRPWLLWTGLLLIVASPELLRHTQSGMADLPLAIYVSLALLCAAGWLASRRGFYLLLVFAFGATALAVKTEAVPQLLLYLAVLSLLGVRRPQRLPALWGAAGCAIATFVPWLAWRVVNGIDARVPLSDAVDPGHLGDRAERVGSAAETLARHLADPTEWLIIVPLALVLSIAAAARTRDVAWLGPALILVAGFAFWTWAYWADRDEIDFVLATSSYRVIDALVLSAGLAVPILAEKLLQSGPWPTTAVRPVISDGRPGEARTS
jgi:hypothetical protein